MRVEVYGPIRKYRLFNAFMVAIIASLIGLGFLHYRRTESEVEEVLRREHELQQRYFTLRTLHDQLSSRLKAFESPPATAAGTGQPNTPELLFGQDGFLVREQLHEGKTVSLQDKIMLELKKVLGQKCQLQLQVPASNFVQTFWIEAEKNFDFNYLGTVLRLQIRTVNPYDRMIEYAVFRLD